MKNYADIYSEYGLKTMINNAKDKIEQLKKDYQEVCEGKRYNPLCKDEWERIIQENIKYYENDIKELEKALLIKTSTIKIKT
jgi:hypothetical protein